MNNSIVKKAILLLSIVLFIFFLNACKTIKAAVSFQWGKRIESKYYLEAKKAPREYPLTSNAGSWIMSKK